MDGCRRRHCRRLRRYCRRLVFVVVVVVVVVVIDVDMVAGKAPFEQGMVAGGKARSETRHGRQGQARRDHMGQGTVARSKARSEARHSRHSPGTDGGKARAPGAGHGQRPWSKSQGTVVWARHGGHTSYVVCRRTSTIVDDHLRSLRVVDNRWRPSTIVDDRPGFHGRRRSWMLVDDPAQSSMIDDRPSSLTIANTRWRPSTIVDDNHC